MASAAVSSMNALTSRLRRFVVLEPHATIFTMASAEVEAWMRDGERRQRRWGLAAAIAVAIAGVVIALVGFAISSNAVPVGDQRAIEAVEASGFRDVMLGGPQALACAEGESSRHFSATNAQGKRVEGTVCCGLTGVGKGCTLRWGR